MEYSSEDISDLALKINA